MRADVAEVYDLSSACGELLTGHDPEIQSAVLADLVATWLAGFQGEGVAEVREELLVRWLEVMRAMIPINEARVLEALKREAN